MATYKVIQDIEAEDKLLGPFTLKQFIYLIIVVVLGFIAFKLATGNILLAIPFLIPMLFFGALAAPLGRDQPTEVWLLAKVRFFLKPRRRVWDQTGMQELVTITAPKKQELTLTNGLSPTEVRSRLRALADTLDSRGWAVKNVNVNLYAQPAYALGVNDSERLIDPSVLPHEVSNLDIQPADDMLDEQNNPVAQQLNQLIEASSREHHTEIMKNIESARRHEDDKKQASPNYWFMNDAATKDIPPPGYTTFTTQTVTPSQTNLPSGMRRGDALAPDEKALLDKVHERKSRRKKKRHGHDRVIVPDSEKDMYEDEPVPAGEQKQTQVTETTPSQTAAPTPSGTGTPPRDPAIMQLANNDDLTVATIARQANQRRPQPPQDEVVISLR